ncbi:MAG: hypothetical protein KME09_01355 [Pleurocapsa minor HA4230-MV1]|nr:hypothetical protein [Pleurocapsa minor HA4230-MV1]
MVILHKSYDTANSVLSRTPACKPTQFPRRHVAGARRRGLRLTSFRGQSGRTNSSL